jgi:hypothetical protein
LDSSQLLKIKLNDSLPVNDTTKAHAIYECYDIMHLCMTKRNHLIIMAASSSDWPVHQLWPPSGGKQRTELDVVLFHGLQLTANDSSDAWSSTWTQRGHDDV